MEDFEKFYNKALKFLSYRPRSEKEVRERLKTKIKKLATTEAQKIIERITEKLKEQKFINDEEFAGWWIESRQRFKPRSLRLIKIELKQKGIDADLINKMINDKGLMINDLENAKKLIQKKFERLKALPKEEMYQKLGRFLASKGFNWDTIKKSIDEVLKKGV